MTTVAERLTADAYLAREDPRRTELLDGVVIVNQPSVLHQRVCARVHRSKTGPARSRAAARRRGRSTWCWTTAPCSPLTCCGSPRPCPPRRRGRRDCPRWRSSATWVYDIGPKRDRYERHGLPELWLADTASRTLLVYRRSSPKSGHDVSLELGAEQTLGSPLLPGLAATVGELIPAT